MILSNYINQSMNSIIIIHLLIKLFYTVSFYNNNNISIRTFKKYNTLFIHFERKKIAVCMNEVSKTQLSIRYIHNKENENECMYM